MDVDTAIRERRSVRIFKQGSLPKEAVMKILDAGRWAPTGCNKQLFEIIVIEKPKLRQQVARLSNNQSYFYQAPLLVLVLHDMSKELVPEGVAPDIPAINSGALIQNMLLQAHSMGIGSLVIGAITKKKELKKLLKIPANYEPMCFVFFGYPDEEPFAPPRRDVNDFVHLNEFGNLSSGKGRKGSLYPNSPNPRRWGWEELIEFKSKILHFGGYLGKCEPTAVTSLTLSLLDIVSVRAKTLATKKILDLFPAEGLFLRQLAWRLSADNDATRFFAVEFSEETAKYLEHVLKRDEVIAEAEALKLTDNGEVAFPFDEEAFDAITCFFRLENLPNTLPILQESWRLLRKDGVMFIAFFCKWGIYDLFRRFRSLNKPNDFNKRWHWYLGPWRTLSYRLLTKQLKSVGFEIINEYHFYDWPSTLKPAIVGLSSLIGFSSSLKKSNYSAPLKSKGLLSSVVLLEVRKKRGL